jgi:amino acid transporter
MILTGARIYAVWGEDFPVLAWLGEKSGRAGPTAAILAQSVIAVLFVLLVGTQAGRDGFDALLRSIDLNGLPWETYVGGFERLISGTAPVYWGLCLLGGLAVIVLRTTDPGAGRPYSMPLYPLPACVLCAACAFMLYASLDYARWLALIGVAPMATGGVIWFFVRGNAART